MVYVPKVFLDQHNWCNKLLQVYSRSMYCDMIAEGWNGGARNAKNVPAETDLHATVEELLKVMSSMWSMLRLHNESIQMN